jgi:hypothetical protein
MSITRKIFLVILVVPAFGIQLSKTEAIHQRNGKLIDVSFRLLKVSFKFRKNEQNVTNFKINSESIFQPFEFNLIFLFTSMQSNTMQIK